MPCSRKTRRMKPASKAVKRVITSEAILHEFCFSASLKPQWIERVFVAIFSLKQNPPEDSAAGILIDDHLMKAVRQQFDIPQESMACPKRMPQYVYSALRLLARNHYISYLNHKGDNERFKLTECFEDILNTLQSTVEEGRTLNSLLDLTLKEHRALCSYFRHLVKSTLRFPRNQTREEIATENLRLLHIITELKKIRPINPQLSQDVVSYGLSQATKQTEASSSRDGVHEMGLPDDSTDAHASDSAEPLAPPQTPVRRSPTLNDPEAYPTPQSVPRRTLSRSSSPQPPQLPSIPFLTSKQEREDGMDIDDPPIPNRTMTLREVADSQTSVPLLNTIHKLDALKTALGNCTERYIALEKASAQRTDGCSALEDVVNEHTEICNTLEKMIKDHKVELQTYEGAVSLIRPLCCALEAILKARIENLKAELSNSTQDTDASVQEKYTAIQETENVIQRKDAAIQEKDGLLASQAATIEDLQKEVARLKANARKEVEDLKTVETAMAMLSEYMTLRRPSSN